jgi:hypothetical protein
MCGGTFGGLTYHPPLFVHYFRTGLLLNTFLQTMAKSNVSVPILKKLEALKVALDGLSESASSPASDPLPAACRKRRSPHVSIEAQLYTIEHLLSVGHTTDVYSFYGHSNF